MARFLHLSCGFAEQNNQWPVCTLLISANVRANAHEFALGATYATAN